MSPKISLFDALVFAFRTVLDNVCPFFLSMSLYFISFMMLALGATGIFLTQKESFFKTGLIYITTHLNQENIQAFITDSFRTPTVLSISLIIVLIAIICISCIIASLIYLSMRVYEGHEIATPDIFHGARHGLYLCMLSLLNTIIIAGGLALLIIPGLYAIIRLAYSPFIIVSESVGILGAIKKSWQTTKGHGWNIVGLYTFFAVAMSMHTAGAIFFIPFFFASGTHLYKKSAAI